MKLIRKHLSIILALSMVLTMPCLAYGTETDAFDVPQTEPEVDVSAMDGERAAEDELLVLIEEDTSKKEIKNITEDAGASLDTLSTLDDGKKLASVSLDDPSDAQEVADSLITEDKVLIVQPNYRYRLDEEETAEEPQTDEEAQAEQNTEQENEEQTPEGTLTTESTPAMDTLATEEELPSDTDKEILIANGTGGRLSIKEKLKDNSKEITQWYMEEGQPGSSHSFKAWEHLSNKTNKVKVAVIDTGVDLDHPDLEGVVDKKECVAVYDGEIIEDFKYIDNADDDDGHGTHVCGIIAANANDGDNYGISGLANNRVELIVIDAENEEYFETNDIVRGISYAASKGAKVINMSLGGLEEDPILELAVNSATEKGVLCVCASGNENSSLPETPGDASGALSVIAHDHNGNKARFSNKGAEKDVSAPGTEIVSSFINKDFPNRIVYAQLNGTSMAAPIVTGLAALIKAENSSLNVREIKNYIFTSSGSESFDANSGFGRINSENAILNVKSEAVEPNKIVLNKTSISMHIGESQSLEYAVYPGTASIHADETSFSSSNESIVSVDKYGHITAEAAGEATITARCKGITATCSVLVKEPPYATVNKLPYRADGVFAPDDYKTKFTHDEGTYSAYTDIYEIKAPDSGRDIRVKLTCVEAIPFVRIYDSEGKEINTDLSTNIPAKDWGYRTTYIVTASFKTEPSKTYRIMALGTNYGSTTVNKKYTIRIDEFAKISEADVSNVVDKTYTGSNVYQSPTLKYSGYTLVNGEDYKLNYSNNKYIGVASVTITGLGAYEGSITKNFKILPKGANISKLKKGKKAVTVKWKKQSSMMPKARINGYQVQVATDSKFTRNVKTASVKGYKKTSKKIGKLKKKTKYYVRIRTYIKTGGTTYYSGWSKVKSTKTR